MAVDEPDRAAVVPLGAGSAYLSEAKGIQRWILDSGPMRDGVGASDLVEGLARSSGNDLIGQVLDALGLDGRVVFSRRAGGAFLLHGDKDALGKARALWRLVAGLHCPGLEMSDSREEGTDALAALRDA